jgi:hypothetical protein
MILGKLEKKRNLLLINLVLDFRIDMRFKLVGNQRASPNADVSPSQLCAVCQGK